jgi:hypothetical protein
MTVVVQLAALLVTSLSTGGETVMAVVQEPAVAALAVTV